MLHCSYLHGSMSTLESCQAQQKQTPASKRQCHVRKYSNNKVNTGPPVDVEGFLFSIKIQNIVISCEAFVPGVVNVWKMLIRCLRHRDALPSLYVRSRKVEPLSSARHLASFPAARIPPTKIHPNFKHFFLSLFTSLCG